MAGRIVPGGKLSDAFIVDALLKKYQLHQPLYRQSQALWRDAQVAVSGSTLGDAVLAAGALLVPLNAAQRQELLAGIICKPMKRRWACKATRLRRGRTTARGNGNTARRADRSSSTFK